MRDTDNLEMPMFLSVGGLIERSTEKWELIIVYPPWYAVSEARTP